MKIGMKYTKKTLAVLSCLFASTNSFSEVLKIGLNNYLERCSNKNAHPSVMLAIIKTESGGNPLSIGLNGRQNGKKIKLARQPGNYEQAIQWVTYLENRGYNFDIGIAQVNIKNVHKYGLRAADALDICKNLQMASLILKNNYNQALYKHQDQQTAVRMAISAYNTGNYRKGFYNGYVSKVINNSKKIKNAT